MKKFKLIVTNYLKAKVPRECIALIDDTDAYLFRTQIWKPTYAIKSKSYFIQRSLNREQVSLNRVINKTKDNECCIFLNGDSLDFRRENLRNISAKDLWKYMRDRKKIKFNE